jgi:hypothetical protein
MVLQYGSGTKHAWECCLHTLRLRHWARVCPLTSACSWRRVSFKGNVGLCAGWGVAAADARSVRRHASPREGLMTAQDLDRIELSLGIALPAEYRTVMMAYPFPSDSSAAELWMPDDAERVLVLNEGYRRGPGRSTDWPRHLFLLGDDGGEEAFVLDTSAVPYPVAAYQLETGRLRPLVGDFQAFMQWQWDELAKIEADEQVMAETYRNKKWWQFWIRPYPPGRAT